jgi:hypothetical protein
MSKITLPTFFRQRGSYCCFKLNFFRWILMFLIAALSNVLLGYGMHGKGTVLSVILPLAVSISFFLIADIDSPRAGVIRIQPQNLYALADSLKAQ